MLISKLSITYNLFLTYKALFFLQKTDFIVFPRIPFHSIRGYKYITPNGIYLNRVGYFCSPRCKSGDLYFMNTPNYQQVTKKKKEKERKNKLLNNKIKTGRNFFSKGLANPTPNTQYPKPKTQHPTPKTKKADKNRLFFTKSYT